ncbi:MAG: hypothetical protein WA988_06875 [Candidatus Nanopelagicales bacterium]
MILQFELPSSRRTAQQFSPLATRINQLFECAHPANRPEQTSADVALALSAMLQRHVPPTVIDALRADTTTVVDVEVLAGLTAYFGVEAEYLLDPTERAIDLQVKLVLAAKHAASH